MKSISTYFDEIILFLIDFTIIPTSYLPTLPTYIALTETWRNEHRHFMIPVHQMYFLTVKLNQNDGIMVTVSVHVYSIFKLYY